MALTPGQQRIAQHWGSFQAAVRDPALGRRWGSITQFVWNELNQAAIAAGTYPHGASLSDVTGLLSLANQQYHAENRLMAAIADYRASGRDLGLDASHIAPDIDARALSQLPLGPSYRVRFDALVGVEGNFLPQRYTWEPDLGLPPTLGGLMDALNQAGAGAASDYGIDFGGVGDFFSITAV